MDIHSLQHNMPSLIDAIPEQGCDGGFDADGEHRRNRGSRGLIGDRTHTLSVLSGEQVEGIHTLKPFLKAVADANRLAILQELARQSETGLSVLDLSERLNLSQPLTSWHLLILKRARLVMPTRSGRQRIYRLNREKLGEYRELFNRVVDM